MKNWDAEEILALSRGYQVAAVLAAAAELDLFAPLAGHDRTAEELAGTILHCDQRGLTVILDALAAIGLLHKTGDCYCLDEGAEQFLMPDSPRTVLAMLQHQANCLRNWAQLADAVKHGRRPAKWPSVRGEQGDLKAFIGAMHNVSAPVADEVVSFLHPPGFTHALDVGGASGTWTAALLRVSPGARVTLFDLPPVIPLARERLASEGMTDRVAFASGDYNRDAFPNGVDLAWLSAVIHQNSRPQNRALFARIHSALVPGGRIAIRDIIMESDRTSPPAGALFAVNMLVCTEAGSTFTFAEMEEDLVSVGFTNARILRKDEGMNAIVVASR